MRRAVTTVGAAVSMALISCSSDGGEPPAPTAGVRFQFAVIGDYPYGARSTAGLAWVRAGFESARAGDRKGIVGANVDESTPR